MRLMVSMMPGRNGFDSGFSNDNASRYPWKMQSAIVA